MFPPLSFYGEQFSRLPPAPTGDQLNGKNVIITGANSGIGLELSYQLAALAPSRLILAVRNLQSGREALEGVLKRHPRLQADVWELDLCSYSSIKSFAEKALKELGTVDLLMNNAGMNAGPKPLPPKITEDGHEASHQTNALSQVLVFLLLLPSLEKSSSPRVVFTTSEVHAWNPGTVIAQALKNGTKVIPAIDGQKTVVGFPQYMLAKLCLQMVIRNLIPIFPHIKIISVNPGLCMSNLSREFKFEWTWAAISGYVSTVLVSRSAEVGARNLSHAAVDDLESTEYFTSCEPSFAPSPFMASATGMTATREYYQEVLEEMEKVAPGCTKSIKTMKA